MPSPASLNLLFPHKHRRLGVAFSAQQQQSFHNENEMDDDSRWATVAPPEHLDTCCVSEVLDANHQTVFATAMSNLLSTEIAEQTFAQIIDGLPLEDVAFSLQVHQHTRSDPVASHVELCPGVLERTMMLRGAFDPRAMKMRTDVRITEGTIANETYSTYHRFYSGTRMFQLDRERPNSLS